MLLFHRQSESINNTPKDLQQLANATVSLSLEDESVEDIVDGFADERAMDHELAVDAVEDGLKVLALAGVLRIKEVENAEHEGVVDVALGDLGIGVGGDDKAEEELVDELEVRPGRIEVGVLLLGIGSLGAGVLMGGRGKAAEYVNGDGADKLLLDRLSETAGA